MYTLIVSNIGTIGKYDTLKVAEYQYQTYVNLSSIGYGRVAGESVTLVDNDGEIIAEYIGNYNEGIQE
jgi:hypothetical protein